MGTQRVNDCPTNFGSIICMHIYLWRRRRRQFIGSFAQPDAAYEGHEKKKCRTSLKKANSQQQLSLHCLA